VTETNSFQDRVHALWDKLPDFSAAKAEEGLHVLMQELGELFGSQNFIYFGTVRFTIDSASDSRKRWRVHSVTYLHHTDELDKAAKEQLRNYQRGKFDLLDVRNVAEAGTYRVNRLVDLVPPEWFNSDFYHRHYRSVGHADAIWAGIPVNEDAEVFCGLFRDGQHPAFSTEERDAFGQALRGLKWFHRQLLLNRGVMVAKSPLTPTEQKVLNGLLSGHSEKVIADMAAHSYNTTHAHVRTIFRKFGVQNRASLMALWLGHAKLPRPPV